MIYFPGDWYWQIDGATGEVFSSKSGSMVAVSNTLYRQWLDRGNAPSPIKTATELYDVMANAGLLTPIMGTVLATQGALSPSQVYQTKIDHGIEVVFTGIPALTAIYPLDAQSQFNMMGIIVGISAGHGFPGGGANLPWPDMSGTQHVFTDPDDFTNLCVAVRDYIAALNAALGLLEAGQPAVWPALPVTIP